MRANPPPPHAAAAGHRAIGDLPRPGLAAYRPARRTAGLAGLLVLPLLWATLAACSTPGPTHPPVLLLGEVHDNAAGHALRLQTLAQQVNAGARPALLMEQFDREMQPQIDQARQHAPGMPPGDAELDAAVDALVKLGSPATGAATWDWALYRPVLRLALQHRLPIVAANVSRADARRVMQQGLAATGFNPAVPADIARAQAADIADSHCGQINPTQAARMALAQVARDQAMAQTVDRYAERGVVLLAGNGHVRNDIGVPRWLSAQTRQRAKAIAYLEPGDGRPANAFDEAVPVPAQPRDDPCKAMTVPQPRPPV